MRFPKQVQKSLIYEVKIYKKICETVTLGKVIITEVMKGAKCFLIEHIMLHVSKLYNTMPMLFTFSVKKLVFYCFLYFTYGM